MPVVPSNSKVYRVEVLGTIHGQEMDMTWAYLSTSGTPPTAADVAAHVKVDIVDEIAALQHDQCHWAQINVHVNNEPAEYAELAIDVTGAVESNITNPSTGAGLAPDFFAVGVRLQRSSLDMGHGSKRFGGLIKANFDGDNLTSTALAEWVAAMGEIELVPGITTGAATLIILRDGPTKNDLTVDPNDYTTWKFTAVSALITKQQLTTQNSRKHGIGA